MKSQPASALQARSFQSPSRARGFTLVELLVVITIIVVLAGITLSVTQNVRRSAIKVADMQNLRSLSAAAMAAGGDNAGRLPAIHAGTDKGDNATPAPDPYCLVGRNTLESYGISKETCYIPRKGVPGGAPDYEWWYKDKSGNDSTPVHYVYYANDTPAGGDPWFMQGSLAKPTKAEYRGTTPYETIIQDQTKAFAKSFTDDAWYTVLWSSLICESTGRQIVAPLVDNNKSAEGAAQRFGSFRPIIAPLVDNNNKPLGVNVMHLDGHAEWVPITKGKLRYTSGSGMRMYW